MKKEKAVKYLGFIDEALTDLLGNGYIDLNDYSIKSVEKARKALALATAQLSKDYKGCNLSGEQHGCVSLDGINENCEREKEDNPSTDPFVGPEINGYMDIRCGRKPEETSSETPKRRSIFEMIARKR